MMEPAMEWFLDVAVALTALALIVAPFLAE